MLRPLANAGGAALALLCGAAPAGAQMAQPQIVGGGSTTIAQHPWQVSVAEGGFFCGGFVLDKRHVGTAAHCVTAPDGTVVPPAGFLVVAGRDDLGQPGQPRSAVAVDRHPGYNAHTFVNDAAVITLSTPFALGATVSPVALPASGRPTPAGAHLTVSGFGVTRDDWTAQRSSQLQSVDVDAVSDATCNADYASLGGITPALMLCAAAPGKDSCPGDSGGPLVTQDSLPVLVGIVSTGNGCAQIGFPGIYAEVAAPGILSFLTAPRTAPASQPQQQAPPAPPDPPPAPVPAAPAPAALPAVTAALAARDTTAPTASLASKRCTSSGRCTLLVAVRDPGFSNGVKGLAASVRSRYPSTCRRDGHTRRCIRTRVRTLKATALGGARFRIRTPRLPFGSQRFSILAIDVAGNRQAAATRVNATTRRARTTRR